MSALDLAILLGDASIVGHVIDAARRDLSPADFLRFVNMGVCAEITPLIRCLSKPKRCSEDGDIEALLVDSGASVNERGAAAGAASALHHVARLRRPREAAWLVEQGASITATAESEGQPFDTSEWTPVMECATDPSAECLTLKALIGAGQ